MKGIIWPVSIETARVWMHRLGFVWNTYKKDLYFDGHDRPDVVASSRRRQEIEKI